MFLPVGDGIEDDHLLEIHEVDVGIVHLAVVPYCRQLPDQIAVVRFRESCRGLIGFDAPVRGEERDPITCGVIEGSGGELKEMGADAPLGCE
jgi:hypothetical protein